MDCDRTDCTHYKVCEEWKSLGNDNYINDSYGNCDYYAPIVSKGECCGSCYLCDVGNCGANMKGGAE